MSAVIKNSTARTISPLRSTTTEASAAFAPAIDPELASLRVTVAEVREALRRAQDETAMIKSDRAAAVAAAREEGRRAGFDEAARDETAALELLRMASERAVAVIAEQLAGTERLAALVARECLDRIFGADEHRTHLLHEIITHQVRQIEAGTIVSVEVAEADFPDLASLEPIMPTSEPRILVRHGRDLARGAIILNLTLGTVSVGLDQQWGRLRSALTDLGESGN